MSGGKKETTTTTAPAYAQPHLETQATEAGNIYDTVKAGRVAPQAAPARPNDIATNNIPASNIPTGASGAGADIVYQGQRVAGLTPAQQAAIGGIQGQTGAYQNLANQASGIGGNLSGQGLTQGGTTAQGVYNQYAADGLGARQKAAGDIYSAQSTGNNDAFARMLDSQSRDMRDQINRQAAASGRYGGGAHQNLLTRDIGDMRAQANANNYFQQQAMRTGAADRMAGLGQQNIANRMGAAGQGAALGQQGFANQIGALNVAGQGQDALGKQNLRALSASGMQQGIDQQRLNAAMMKHEQEQQAPWEDLRRYNQAIAPTIVGGTSTNQQPSTGLGGVLGGAAGGAQMGSMFGPWGTAGGALLGGIGSMF